MSQKVQHLRKWANTAKRAVTQGGEFKSGTRIYWNVAGRGRLECQRPVYREYLGADAVGYDFRTDRAQGRINTRSLELDTRCRRCPPCLEYRKLLWRGRARAEIANSARTWFGTLTVEPDFQIMAKYRASLRLAKSGVDLERLSREEQFAEHVSEIMPEITKWFKRVRKKASVDLRQQYRKSAGCKATIGKRCSCHRLADFTVPLKYLLVVEEHTGGGAQHGLPHFHLLIHEKNMNRPVRYANMEQKWSMGITHFKLISDDATEGAKFANYVTKYLTKSILCRARASVRYGQAEQSYNQRPRT